MVRETRYLWVGNLPESIGEDQICDHFSSYGKIQSVKLIPRHEPSEKLSAVVAFMDIKAASKAHDSENIIAGVTVETEYNESSAAVNTSARNQDCSTQKSAPSGASGQTQGTNVQLQQSVHTGRPQQRADGLAEDLADVKITEQGESRDSRKTSERGPTRGSGVDHDLDRDRSRPRPYPGSHSSHFSSHRSHLDSHGNQGSKLVDSKTRTDSSRSESLGLRSGRPRSRSRSTGRSQSQGSSESGSQSCGQSGEKKLSSVVQLPGQASISTQKNEDQQSEKPRGLLIHGFPARSTDTSVRDGLFHDYKKYYRGVTVIVEGQGDARYAVVSFKKHEDAAKALEDSKDKRFFGTKVTVATHPGFEIENSENHSLDSDHNEYSHKATRTLFVGNLDKTTNKDMLRDLFSKYGYIIEIDIKNQGQALSYAFIQFDNIRSVVQALHDMDDKYINTNKVKLGFGKVIPSSCVWVDGISDTISEKYLTNQFAKFGLVMSTYIDRRTGRALIFFETSDHASAAINEMRGKCILEKKIQVDFASRECQTIFLDNMESSGQLRPGDRPEDRANRGCIPYGPQEFVRQRPGFEGPPSRGGRFHGYDGPVRGSYNGSRDAFYNVGNRIGSRGGFYDGFAHDRREGLPLRGPQKFFDGHPEDAVFFDSYERELKEYGFSRRDRDVSPSMERHRSFRTTGPDSPRSSRYSSPSRERLDDAFPYRFGDAKNKDSELSYSGESRKDRLSGKHKFQGFSPANSDFSQISKGRNAKRDSRSISPVSAKQRYRKERSTSPTSKDCLWNSTSTDELGYHMTSQRGSKESLDCYIFSEKPGKGPVYNKPYAGSGSKKSRSSRCDDDNEVLSDRDRSLRGLDQQPLRPKRLIDEPNARRRSVELPSDLERQRKLELEIARNLGYPNSGSAREYGPEFGAADPTAKHQLSPKYDERTSGGGGSMMDMSLVRRFGNSVTVAQVSSGSTTPGSKTPVNNSDQDSLGGRNSHGSDDVQTLEKQKQLLLNLLKQMEATSGSDVELPDDDIKKEPIVVVDSDLEVENDPESLRKDYFNKAGDRKNPVIGFHDADNSRKECLKSKEVAKQKLIDTTQGFRKQMEAQKKQGDPDLGSRSSSSSPVQTGQLDRLALTSCRNPLDIVDPYDACNSPVEIPNDFIPARRQSIIGDGLLTGVCVKNKRSYRTKLSDDGFSSSNDEELGAFSPSSSRHSRRSVGHDDDAGISASGLSESMAHASRVISVESSWSGDELLKEHQLPLQRSRRLGTMDGRIEVCIIPDSPVIKGCEGSGPQEPRKTVGVCRREEAIDLPLPRFAYDTLLSKSPVLPKPSTPVAVKTSEVAQRDLTADDPPFSPSFTSSPCIEKVDSKPVDLDIFAEKLAEEKVLKLELVESKADLSKPNGCVDDELDDAVSTVQPIVVQPAAIDEQLESFEPSSMVQLDSVNSVSDDVAAGDTKDVLKVDMNDDVKPLNDGDGIAKCSVELNKSVCLSSDELQSDTSVDASQIKIEKPSIKTEKPTLKTEKPSLKIEIRAIDLDPSEADCAADTTKDIGSDKNLLEPDDSKAALSKQNASDSDVSDLLSPAPSLPSIEERIRALDDMLKLVAHGGKPTGIVSEALPSPALDYREKYGRRRREPSSQLPQQTENRNEVSALARTLLSRSSIFDQDSQRLEQLHVKYEPGSIHSGRLPNTEPYSSMYSPLFRSGVGDVVPVLSSNPSYGYLCSPAVGDIPRPGWNTPGLMPGNLPNWNASGISQQHQLMISTAAWPSSAAVTPSPLMVSTVSPLSVNQSSVIVPPPLWASTGIPIQPGLQRPTSLESPAPGGVRVAPFFHQASFDGTYSTTSTTPPYSGTCAMVPHPVLISNADPRRLSRPDLTNVSPLLSPPITNRQDSHSSDLDIWAVPQKHDPMTPTVVPKPKELVSPPVSILKKQPSQDVSREIQIASDTPSVTSVVDAMPLPGVKRKADVVFGLEVSALKSSSQTKIPKISAQAKSDGGVSKSDKDGDERSQKPVATSENKKHSFTSGLVSGGKAQTELKKPTADNVSPKPVQIKSEDKKPDVSSLKKLEDSTKSHAKKLTKPSAPKVCTTQPDKVDHIKKENQGKVSIDITGDASVDGVSGRDKLGKAVKTKVPAKDGMEKEKEKPVQELKDQAPDKLKEKIGHTKHKMVEQKSASKPKEGGSEDGRKVNEPIKEEGKKVIELGKNNIRKERLMSLDSNKEEAKKLEEARKAKTTNRENSKEGIKKDKSRHAERTITAGDPKLSKDKLKLEKAIISKPKTPPVDSSDKSAKKDKTALKINKKERHECKENMADISKHSKEPGKLQPDAKSQNSGTGKSDSKQQQSSESKSSNTNRSRGDRERDSKSESKKKPSEGSRTDKKSEADKKKKSSEKSKEKRPEEKREIKALLQESHASESPAYVSMYDMVKRRSKMRGRDDSFGSLEDRSKCLSQLQARSSKRKRSKASLESSILNSDEDDDFRDDSNTTLESKSDRSRKKSTTKRRIDSSSSPSSSDDEKVTKPLRSKTIRTIEDDSSSGSDTSMEHYFSSKNKPLNEINAHKSAREPIYSSSSDLNDDSDSKSDEKISKSKPALGKGHKVNTEVLASAKKTKVTVKKKPVARHSMSSDDDDDGGSNAPLSAGNHAEETRNAEKKPSLLDLVGSASKSKKENTKVEFPTSRKDARNITDAEPVESKDKPKRVEKSDSVSKEIKKDLTKDHPTPAKNESRPGKVKGLAVADRKEESIARADDKEDLGSSVKKERHADATISSAKEKVKERPVIRSESQTVLTDPERKGDKDVDGDRNRAVKNLDMSFQKQTSKAAKVPSSNTAVSKNGSVVLETEKGNRAHIRRDSVHEKTRKKLKLDVKATIKSEKEDEPVVEVEASVSIHDVVTESAEPESGESLKESVRSDNIFEKMERKDEIEKLRDVDVEVVVKSEVLSLTTNANSFGLEKQYSTISETRSETPMAEEEEEVELVVPPPAPLPELPEPSRMMKDRPDLDSAKLTAEKLKEDASKVETIVEAVRTIIDIDRDEQTTTDRQQDLDNSLDVVDPCCGGAAEELAGSEVLQDDSEEVTQAIEILLGKEMGPSEPEQMVIIAPQEDEEEEVEEEDRLIVSQEFEEGKALDAETVQEEVMENSKMKVSEDFGESKPVDEALPEILSPKVESEFLPEKVQDSEVEVKSELEQSSAREEVVDMEVESPKQAAGAESVFVEPKPLAQKEVPTEKEKDAGVKTTENASGIKPPSAKLKLELNGPASDCADYFAGYFSPYPCVPKEESEEVNPPLAEVEQVVCNMEAKSPGPAPLPVSSEETVTSGSTADVVQVPKESVKEETCVVKMETSDKVPVAMTLMEPDILPPKGLQNNDLYEFKDDEKSVPMTVFSSSLSSGRARKRPGDQDSGDDSSAAEAKKPRMGLVGEGPGIPTSVEAFSKEEARVITSSAAPVSSGMTHLELVQNMLSHAAYSAPAGPKPSANQSPSATVASPLFVSAAMTTPPPTWQSNMDRVIDEVAKGNFQRGHEFDFYVSQKKPRSKSRDEQLHQPHYQQQSPQLQQVPTSHSIGPSYAHHSDMAKQQQQQHVIMTPGFLQMSPGGGTGVGPRGDASSLHHLQMYNAGVAAARQFVSQPQIVMLSSDKTSPRLTSPLIHNPQTPFRPSTSVYQPGLLTSAMVSSAGTGQQQGLLFCQPPVGYQFSSVAGSHSESGNNQLHRFLSPREEIARNHPACSQPHQNNPSPSSRAIEKLSNMPIHSRPGQDATSQNMNTVLSTANVHNLHDQGSHANIRLMPVSVSHGTLMAHNPSSSVQSVSVHHGGDPHQHQMIQAQAHLQLQHHQQQQQQHHQQQQQQNHHHQQQQQQQQKTPEAMSSASSGQGQNADGHGRDYIYRPVGNTQMRFEGVPTLSSLGIVGLDSSMFHPMSPKISDGLLQSLPRQPGGTLVAHFGGYPQQVQYGMMLPHGSLANAKDTPGSSVPVSSSSASGAASELREALAQPSRLAQQEQLIQQQQNVLHSVRPHALPDLCPSPVGLGQHRMPFTIQEPRSMSTSRAEPKAAGPPSSVESSAALPSGPPISLVQPFGDPASAAACHQSSADKVPLGMVEMRTAGGQQMYRSDPRIQMLKYDQGVAAAHGLAIDTRQLEQLMLSGRVMSPQIAAQHHLMVSGQMQSQQQQQQPAVSPFSHPDHSIGRPPSVHHLPSSSAPQSHIARPSPDNSDGIGSLLQRFPVMWNGTLELKNDRAPVQMHFISGNRTLVPASLQENNKPLHIGQRMRLEAAQLEQVSRRMMNESEYSMLVAVPSGVDTLTLMTAAHSLQNGFIRYLQEKQAAGIVNIYQPSTNQATYVIHIFPPCEFSNTNLSRFAPDIVQNTSDSNYLLIVITTC